MPIVLQVCTFKKADFLILYHCEILTTAPLSNYLCENKCQLAVGIVTLFCQECN